MFRHTYIFTLATGISMILIIDNAHAYIDPGAGSMAFQVLIATLMGVFFTAKLWYGKLTGIIRGLFRKNNKGE